MIDILRDGDLGLRASVDAAMLASLVELLQLEGAGELDGRSLASDLETGNETLGERTLFWDGRWQERFVGAAVESAGMRLIAVQQDYSGMRDESLLFDLEVDAAETRNLAAGAPETARRLRAELDRHLIDAASRALRPVPRAEHCGRCRERSMPPSAGLSKCSATWNPATRIDTDSICSPPRDPAKRPALDGDWMDGLPWRVSLLSKLTGRSAP